jgi:hypothetical protein
LLFSAFQNAIGNSQSIHIKEVFGFNRNIDTIGIKGNTISTKVRIESLYTSGATHNPLPSHQLWVEHIPALFYTYLTKHLFRSIAVQKFLLLFSHAFNQHSKLSVFIRRPEKS